jgi:hypothetical protein
MRECEFDNLHLPCLIFPTKIGSEEKMDCATTKPYKSDSARCITNAMLPMIVKHKSLCHTLPLIITASHPCAKS